MEEEERQKNLEYIKIKEWEENFDKEQKLREEKELRREQKIKEKELEKLRLQEESENIKSPLSSTLENFNIDKSKKN